MIRRLALLALLLVGCMPEPLPPKPSVCNGACAGLDPVGDEVDCHGVEINLESEDCIRFTFEDGTPCARGVGHCESGTCIFPAEPGMSDPPFPHGAWETCSYDADCDDGNLCTEDRCLSAACGPCRHVAIADGTKCVAFDQVGTCVEGACLR